MVTTKSKTKIRNVRATSTKMPRDYQVRVSPGKQGPDNLKIAILKFGTVGSSIHISREDWAALNAAVTSGDF